MRVHMRVCMYKCMCMCVCVRACDREGGSRIMAGALVGPKCLGIRAHLIEGPTLLAPSADRTSTWLVEGPLCWCYGCSNNVCKGTASANGWQLWLHNTEHSLTSAGGTLLVGVGSEQQEEISLIGYIILYYKLFQREIRVVLGKKGWIGQQKHTPDLRLDPLQNMCTVVVHG